MALSQSVASELLEAFRAGDGVDLIRESVQMVLHDLIEVEATKGSAPAATNAAEPERLNGLVLGRGRSSPRPGMWSWRSRSCGRVRSCRSSSNAAGGSIRPCMRC